MVVVADREMDCCSLGVAKQKAVASSFTKKRAACQNLDIVVLCSEAVFTKHTNTRKGISKTTSDTYSLLRIDLR